VEWLRSVTVIGMAFVGVLVATLGLAAVIVPGRTASSQDGVMGSPGASALAALPTLGGIPGLGGSLVVTGDREGTLVVTRESQELTYALVGGDGRITFEGAPVVVTQVSYDGWDFFPDEGDCTVTPGNLDNAVGIGFAELVCTDIADVRDNGIVSISGTIGLPVDRLVGRELPVTGGSIEVGDETWSFEFALLLAWQQPAIGGVTDANMTLLDEAQGTALHFFYDIETHRTTVSDVMRDGQTVAVPEGACTLNREELGRPNPRAVTIELTIDCPTVDIPGLGAVPISGTVIVDELEFPF
jgi:hypothetical protein